MFIGEAPGENEDREGRPFVGRSGELLDLMIMEAGISEYYITNLVKQRPPKNRNPTQVEIGFYLPYIFEEILLVNPGIALTVGSIATKAILGASSSITALRGKIHHLGGYTFMPIFHPAYLLRRHGMNIGSPRWLTKIDLQTARKELLRR
jgi:DNA polymerase